MREINSNEGKVTSFLTQEEIDAIIVHLLFSILCVFVLQIPISIVQGLRISLLVLIYIITVPIISKIRRYPEWLNLWLFSIALSIFQFFPDLFLSAQLEILIFPEDGFIRVFEEVSIYMFGL